MDQPRLAWDEAGAPRGARWRSEAGVAPPRRVVPALDTLTADQAVRLASEGTGLLWRSDFQNARHLLQAMARRIDRQPRRPPPAPATPLEAFHRHRQAQGQRAGVLGKVLIELDGDYRIALPRAPDLREACREAWGPPDGESSVAALRELLGLVGAHE